MPDWTDRLCIRPMKPAHLHILPGLQEGSSATVCEATGCINLFVSQQGQEDKSRLARQAVRVRRYKAGWRTASARSPFSIKNGNERIHLLSPFPFSVGHRRVPPQALASSALDQPRARLNLLPGRAGVILVHTLTPHSHRTPRCPQHAPIKLDHYPADQLWLPAEFHLPSGAPG